jgi:DNA-binding NtrC family response regulator
MSEMDGLQTFHELRRQGVTSRIVLMSAHGRGPEWNEALKLNVELFEKPILEETLVSILSEL